MKLQMVAPSLLTDVLNTFDLRWAHATPQHDSGSYWKMPAVSDRRLDWNLKVADLLRIVRAFSKFESSGIINGKSYNITRANGWVEQPREPCGTLVHESNRELVVAVSDGYLVLQEYSAAKG
jgi:methionyl-tRNA formyltransferase